MAEIEDPEDLTSSDDDDEMTDAPTRGSMIDISTGESSDFTGWQAPPQTTHAEHLKATMFTGVIVPPAKETSKSSSQGIIYPMPNAVERNQICQGDMCYIDPDFLDIGRQQPPSGIQTVVSAQLGGFSEKRARLVAAIGPAVYRPEETKRIVGLPGAVADMTVQTSGVMQQGNTTENTSFRIGDWVGEGPCDVRVLPGTKDAYVPIYTMPGDNKSIPHFYLQPFKIDPADTCDRFVKASQHRHHFLWGFSSDKNPEDSTDLLDHFNPLKAEENYKALIVEGIPQSERSMRHARAPFGDAIGLSAFIRLFMLSAMQGLFIRLVKVDAVKTHKNTLATIGQSASALIDKSNTIGLALFDSTAEEIMVAFEKIRPEVAKEVRAASGKGTLKSGAGAVLTTKDFTDWARLPMVHLAAALIFATRCCRQMNQTCLNKVFAKCLTFSPPGTMIEMYRA